MRCCFKPGLCGLWSQEGSSSVPVPARWNVGTATGSGLLGVLLPINQDSFPSAPPWIESVGPEEKKVNKCTLLIYFCSSFLPSSSKKKLLLLYSSHRTENIWNYTANAMLWLKRPFFLAHGMTSNGFFSSIWTREWWNSPVCQKSVWGSWPARPWSVSCELGRTESLGRGRIRSLTVFQMNIFIYLKAFQPGSALNAGLPVEKCWVLAFYFKF